MTELNNYPWHEQQKNQLTAGWQQQRLPHALLFQGVAGLGKHAFAKNFAQLLVCKQPAVTQPCHQCSSCQLFVAGTHPDIYIIQRESDAKFISVEQIRELSAKLMQTSSFQGYRVAIIDDAQYLHTAAANALLKTLEEPPTKTLLILITEQLQYVPVTLRSRCQIINFLPPKNTVAKTWLKQQLPNNETQIEILLKLAQGAPLRVLTYITTDTFKIREQLLVTLQAITLDKANPLSEVTQFKDTALTEIFFYWQLIVMDIVRLAMSIPTSACVNIDHVEFLTRIANQKPLSVWLKFLDQMLELQKAQSSVTLNQQTALEKLFSLWYLYTQH